MDNQFVLVVTAVAALGCGLVAGALFAFSSFVMNGLARLPSPQGIAAMQSINVEAPKPAFMLAFMGTAVVSLVVAIAGLVDWDTPSSIYLLIGCALYLIGVIGLTGGYHVPRNNALATLDPESAESASQWRDYATTWTRWNHVRVGAGVAAAAMFTVALRVG